MPTIFHPESIADAQAAIRSSSKICIVGNGTKKRDVSLIFPKDTLVPRLLPGNALSQRLYLPDRYESNDASAGRACNSIDSQAGAWEPDDGVLAPCEFDTLDLTRISGIVEYDPSEFTITARAGTRLEELFKALAERGQFLPFDPPLIGQGATVGGMIASGISGPSRLRFGGVRDFVLGVKFIDGTGTLAMAGGKVVKNAAGFDIPKLLVGSWGEFAALVEVTLKVFPRPADYCSVRIEADGIEHAIALVHRLTRSPLDLDAIDIEDSRSLLVRLGGLPEAIEKGAERAIARCEANGAVISPGPEEARLWSPLLDWSWCRSDESLVRVPLTTSKIVELELELVQYSVRRRYSVAGNLAWIAWPRSVDIENLDRILHSLSLVGRIVRGEAMQSSQIGLRSSDVFASRIRRAMDPENRFVRRS